MTNFLLGIMFILVIFGWLIALGEARYGKKTTNIILELHSHITNIHNRLNELSILLETLNKGEQPVSTKSAELHSIPGGKDKPEPPEGGRMIWPFTKMYRCNVCKNKWPSSDKRGHVFRDGDTCCPLCWVVMPSYDAWMIVNDCQGAFVDQSYSTRAEAVERLEADKNYMDAGCWVEPIMILRMSGAEIEERHFKEDYDEKQLSKPNSRRHTEAPKQQDADQQEQVG